MEKYCKSCGSVFNDLKYKLCPYCGGELDTRYGRQPIPRKLRHEVFKRNRIDFLVYFFFFLVI